MFYRAKSAFIALIGAVALTTAGSISAQQMSFEDRMDEAPRNYSESSYANVNIPATNSPDYRVVQVEFKGRPTTEVRRPEAALFHIDGYDQALRYHYIGEEDGVYSYLTAVPLQYTGEVTINGYFGARPADFTNRSESRESLVLDRKIVGAPDIVLLVDESGSMGAGVSGGLSRSDVAQQVVNNIVPELEAKGSRVGVVGYDSSSRVALGVDQDYRYMGFSASGGTGTDGAVSRARNILRGRNSSAQVIIDITDGVANSPGRTANQVQAAEGEGIAVAAIGIGKRVPSYYPYSDYVNNSAANFRLEDELADLVKRTEERARNIEKPCNEGGICTSEPLDTIDPSLEITTMDSDDTMTAANDLYLTSKDRHSGINPEQVDVTISMGSESFDAPFESPEGVDYMLQVSGTQGARIVEYAFGDLGDQSDAYIQALMDAYINDRPISIEARVRDMEGNSTRLEKTLEFKPPVFEAEPLSMPSVDHAFVGKDGGPSLRVQGRPIIVESAADRASVEYMAILGGTNTELMLDDQKVGSDVFTRVGEVSRAKSIRAEVKPANPGPGDQGTIFLIPENANGKVVKLPFTLWNTEIDLSLSESEPVQGLTQMTISPNNTTPCTLDDNRNAVERRNALEQPTCFVRWNQVPGDLYQDSLSEPGVIKGIIANEGINAGTYDVLMGDNGEEMVTVHSGEFEVDVTPVEEAISFGLSKTKKDYLRLIEEVDIAVVQNDGPECEIFKKEEEALASARNNKPSCLVQWENLPLGVEEVVYQKKPVAEGRIKLDREQTATFKWSASVVMPNGEMAELPDGSHQINLSDPAAPQITYNADEEVEDRLFAVDQEGGYVADVRFQGEPADMVIEIKKNGETFDKRTFQGSVGGRVQQRIRINADEEELWNRDDYSVSAHYKLIPRISSEDSFEVLSTPSDSLRLAIEPDAEEVLDTESLGALVRIDNPFVDGDYDPSVMGEWDAHLVDQVTLTNQTKLTESKRLDENGEASYEFDLEGLDKRTLRLGAKGVVDSPVDAYEKVIEAARPAFIAVLRGGPIEADLEARQVEGPAPLQIIASAELRNRLDYDAVEKVAWQTRSDQGEWTDVENDGSFELRYSQIFEEGKHALRAKITNRNSDEVFVTQALEIHAFSRPDIAIDGPANAFIGSTADFEIIDRESGEPLSNDEYDIQWSETGGDSWSDGNNAFSVSRNALEDVRVGVRVRSSDAPANNEEAWVDESMRVSFREVREPNARLYGPRLVEVGEEYYWEGRAREPYRDMDIEIIEEVVLPNGDVIPGKGIDYVPTEKDGREETVKLTYRASIVGYEEQGAVAVDERRVRVWKYKWPQWTISDRRTANQAPADIEMRLRALGTSVRTIEGLEVDWKIPSEVEILEDYSEQSRSLRVEDPGQYTVIAEVSDERGNFSEVRHDLNILPADDWVTDMSLIYSNEYMRAPLSVRTRPDVRGGHPRDRPETYRYYLNGQLHSEENRYEEIELEEGEHEITLKVDTEFGETSEVTKSVTVIPNKLPVCEIEARGSSGSWRFRAECTDPDGRVRDFEWSLNGEKLEQGGSRISVRDRESRQLPVVELVGIDDSGGRSAPVQATFTSAQKQSVSEKFEEQEERDDRRSEQGSESDDERSDSEAENKPVTADDWSVNLRLRYGNDEMTAPLRVAARPDVDGPRRDDEKAYRYYVDGNLYDEGGKYERFEFDAGQHTVKFEVVTEKGFTVSDSVSFEVTEAGESEGDAASDEDESGSDNESQQAQSQPDRYQWPDFVINTRRGSEFAPAVVTVDLSATDGSVRRIDGLQVDWQYPDVANVLRERRAYRQTIGLPESGAHAITAEISDQYGNTATATTTITLNDAPDWQVEPTIRKDREDNREPLGVRIGADATGGHESDRVDRYAFFVDGKSIGEGRRAQTVLDAGEHTLKVVMTSDFGETVEAIRQISVAENQPPQCEIGLESREDLHTYTAQCTDSDGRIDGYEWQVDGEPVRGRRDAIRLRVAEGDPMPSVTVIAIDDGGARSAPATR